MKTTLTIVLSILSFCAFAQAPQGFTYQAVATDNNGLELVEQNVSVRVSILSESSTGVEQWIETHSTTTDGFGLFTITIGEGTSTGNGVQSSFSDIDWGGSEHHLKIEMDVDGGSDYQLLGISQLMSVPYALYAESSGAVGPEGPEGPPGEPADSVDYDFLANMISIDSTFLASVTGGMGGGCVFNYPEGIYGEGITWDFTSSNSYTVPIGKSLYITNIYSANSDNTFRINGLGVRDGNTNNSSTFYGSQEYSNMLSSPIIAGSGQIIIQENTGGPEGAFTGFLVDSDNIEIVTHCLCPGECNLINGSSYTVPPGKKLYIINLYSGNQFGDFLIDGVLIKSGRTNNDAANSIHQPIVVNSGMTVSSTSGSSQAVFNGYLVDENYFANCGGGSSSTTTSSNSVGDFSYPDGKEGITPVIHDFGNGDYSVPSGKNLYITSYLGYSASNELQISSNTVFKGRGQYSGQDQNMGHFELPIIAGSSEILSIGGASGTMNGFLVEASITPITLSLSGINVDNITYTVPPGKILVVLNFYSAMDGLSGELLANGLGQLYGIFNYHYGPNSSCNPPCITTNIKTPIFFDENTILTTGNALDLQVVNGYLMDK